MYFDSQHNNVLPISGHIDNTTNFFNLDQQFFAG